MAQSTFLGNDSSGSCSECVSEQMWEFGTYHCQSETVHQSSVFVRLGQSEISVKHMSSSFSVVVRGSFQMTQNLNNSELSVSVHDERQNKENSPAPPLPPQGGGAFSYFEKQRHFPSVICIQ